MFYLCSTKNKITTFKYLPIMTIYTDNEITKANEIPEEYRMLIRQERENYYHESYINGNSLFICDKNGLFFLGASRCYSVWGSSWKVWFGTINLCTKKRYYDETKRQYAWEIELRPSQTRFHKIQCGPRENPEHAEIYEVHYQHEIISFVKDLNKKLTNTQFYIPKK